LKREEIILLAKEFGFNRVKIAAAKTQSGIEHYDRFLSKGFHGTMSWMVRSRPPRADIRQLLPDAQSVIVLGLDYRHPRPPRPDYLAGRVSCYAWGRDYHKIIGKQLRNFGKLLQAKDPEVRTYWGVDSRPLIERAWAQEAGLGFLGKNCQIISPADSSFYFLAVMLINQKLEPDLPLPKDHCGRCTRCLKACPTDAFIAPYQIDSRRCISYLTIEYDGVVEEEMAKKMDDWVFGCDVCQDVCPHNHKVLLSKHPELAPRPKHAWLDLEWLFRAPEQEILDELAGTPLRRAGVERLRRNAAISLSNQNLDADEQFRVRDWIKDSTDFVQQHFRY
jgi:epoxyqueuosine reductase